MTKCRFPQLSAIPRAFDDKDHAILQQQKLVPAFGHFLKTTLVLERPKDLVITVIKAEILPYGFRPFRRNLEK